MREIEFRIRDYDDVWYYGLPTYFNKTENTCAFQSFDHSFFDAFADRKTLCQYTGLTDKNGTKIFEGDILCMTIKNEWTNNKELKIYYYVKFNDGMFATFYKDYEDGEFIEIEEDRVCKALIDVDKLEVVGNIHDNPELIEKVEE